MLESTSITKKKAKVKLSNNPSTWSDVSRSKVFGSPTLIPPSASRETIHDGR